MSRYLNVSFYSFFTIADPQLAKVELREAFASYFVRGTVLLAHEGANLNLSGSDDDHSWFVALKNWLTKNGCTETLFKLSYSSEHSFKRLKIKVKKEIVTSGRPDLDVQKWRGPHMKPAEFKRFLETYRPESSDTIVLDTRNNFEFEKGTFEGALPADITNFRSFDAKVDGLSKDKKIIMFCTGGIRCEKASAIMRAKGFAEVWQLEGGILKYFEDEGGAHFRGDCFVFDERVALDPDLNDVSANSDTSGE